MANVREHIDESSRVISSLAHRTKEISEILKAIESSLNAGGKLIVLGNGGSAAQAQHVAAELVVRFRNDRRTLPAIALTTDTSILTAMANDYGFEYVFSRPLEALADSGDVVLALSTSGNSPNVLKAVEKARELGIVTVALLGRGGGQLKGKADIELIVDSDATERIQEAHLLILHIIADTVESGFIRSRGLLEE
jgi:D-sedoheptulose 7-phosphate isomerase